MLIYLLIFVDTEVEPRDRDTDIGMPYDTIGKGWHKAVLRNLFRVQATPPCLPLRPGKRRRRCSNPAKPDLQPWPRRSRDDAWANQWACQAQSSGTAIVALSQNAVPSRAPQVWLLKK